MSKSNGFGAGEKRFVQTNSMNLISGIPSRVWISLAMSISNPVGLSGYGGMMNGGAGGSAPTVSSPSFLRIPERSGVSGVVAASCVSVDGAASGAVVVLSSDPQPAIAATKVDGESEDEKLAHGILLRGGEARPYQRLEEGSNRPARAQARVVSSPDAQAQPGARTGSRRPRALRDRLRKRRLVDLLRARRHGRIRARADPRRLPDRGPHLRGDRCDLRRGDGALPGGRRLRELRAARVQRARQLRGRLGADAELHHHDRHLGVLRAALPLDLLGAAPREPVGHHRRHRRDRRPRRDQHRRAFARRRA